MRHLLRHSTFFILHSTLALGAFCALSAQNLPSALGPNLALNKPYLSSDPNISGWDTGLTDGSWNPAKPNTYATGATAKFPKTVTIDLQTLQPLTAILVGTPRFGSTKTIAASISPDGKKFTTIGTNDFINGKNDTHLYQFKPVPARYVRLTFAGNAEKYDTFRPEYCFITEVEVFGVTGSPTQSNLGKTTAPAAPPAPKPPPIDPKLELPRPPLPENLGPNLALGKPYTCDDKNPAPTWNDLGLTDGLWAMRRGPTFATNGTNKFPKTVTIDLRSTARLTHILVAVPDFGSTKTIAISVSYDGKTYTEVGRHDYPFARAEAHLFQFPPTLARQIRLTYLANHPEKNRYTPTYCFTTEVEAYAQP